MSVIIPLFAKTDKLRFLLIAVGFLSVGCQTAQQIEDVKTPVEQTETGTKNQPHGLAPDLATPVLYDVMVANIAKQRNQPELALEYLSRAAYQSRSPRLIIQAIQLALETQNFQQTADLGRLLESLEPDSFRATFFLAHAQLKLGKLSAAMERISSFLRKQPRDPGFIFRDIAALLAEQGPATILEDFLSHNQSGTQHEGIAMTAAALAFLLERWDTFLALIDKVLDTSPDWESPAILKLTYLANKHPSEFSIYADRHLKSYSGQEYFRLQYAGSLLQLDRPDEALKQFAGVLELNPDSQVALYASGTLYMNNYELGKSSRLFKHYLEIGGKKDEARIYLSEFAHKNKNYNEAIKYLYGVTSEHYLDAQIRLGRITADRDGLEAGIQYIDQINILNEEEERIIYLEKASLYKEQGIYETALALLDEALHRFPNDSNLLYNRGILYLSMGFVNLHEIDMRKIIELDPSNAHAYNALGYTLADQTDRFDEAMGLIGYAYELSPNNAYVLDSMGWIHYRLGNHEMAIKFLRQALAIKKDAEIAAHLGEVLWINDKFFEATKIWDQAIKWDSDNNTLQETMKRLFRANSSSIENLNSNFLNYSAITLVS